METNPTGKSAFRAYISDAFKTLTGKMKPTGEGGTPHNVSRQGPPISKDTAEVVQEHSVPKDPAQEPAKANLGSHISGSNIESKKTLTIFGLKISLPPFMRSKETKLMETLKQSIRDKVPDPVSGLVLHESSSKNPIEARKNILNVIKNFYEDPTVTPDIKVKVAAEMQMYMLDTKSGKDGKELNSLADQIHELGEKVTAAVQESTKPQTPEATVQPKTEEKEQPKANPFGRRLFAQPKSEYDSIRERDDALSKQQQAGRLQRPEIDRLREKEQIPGAAKKVFENRGSLLVLENNLKSLQNHIEWSGSTKPDADAVQALRDAEGSSKETIDWLKSQIKDYRTFENVVGTPSFEQKELMQFERFWAAVYKQL